MFPSHTNWFGATNCVAGDTLWCRAPSTTPLSTWHGAALVGHSRVWGFKLQSLYSYKVRAGQASPISPFLSTSVLWWRYSPPTLPLPSYMPMNSWSLTSCVSSPPVASMGLCNTKLHPRAGVLSTGAGLRLLLSTGKMDWEYRWHIWVDSSEAGWEERQWQVSGEIRLLGEALLGNYHKNL